MGQWLGKKPEPEGTVTEELKKLAGYIRGSSGQNVEALLGLWAEMIEHLAERHQEEVGKFENTIVLRPIVYQVGATPPFTIAALDMHRFAKGGNATEALANLQEKVDSMEEQCKLDSPLPFIGL